MNARTPNPGTTHHDRRQPGHLSRRDLLKLGLGLAGLALISCGDVNPTPTPDPDPDPDPDPNPDPGDDPTLPPQNPSGMSASAYWSSIGGHPAVDVSRIVAGSEDNSVAWFLDWLHVRMEAPTNGPRFTGTIGMIPAVAQSYIDRFGRFGNVSDQARLAIETYFEARDALTQTVDLRTDGPYVHPDAYVDGWRVGLWMPHHGPDVWFPSHGSVSRPEDTGLEWGGKFSGIRYTDLNPLPNETVIDFPDAIDNILSLLGYEACKFNVTQDWPDNAPGFSLVVDTDYADSLPGGARFYQPFAWPVVVEELRAYPGNTQMHLRATQIDRALWDVEYMVMIVAHLNESPVRYPGWSYDSVFGVPAEGQVIPPMMAGERSVIASVSTQLGSRFSDSRILAPPSFGESRLYNPTQPLGEFADHHLITPLDYRLSPGKWLGVADGGMHERPVWDPSNPSLIVGYDYRAHAPCGTHIDTGELLYLPDRPVEPLP